MDNLKKRLSLLLVLMLVFTMMPVSASVAEEVAENYEVKVLTFEGGYWDSLIDENQYGGPLLYGDGMGFSSEEEAYKWADPETGLSHILPYNYNAYCYMGGGHAISNYVSGDYETYGDYLSQLTVYKAGVSDIERSGGGHSGSNFVMHYGYIDGSEYNQTENLPELTFSDGQAYVIDHMYVNMSNYMINCLLNGNDLTEAGGSLWVKAIGYNNGEKTGETTIYLADDKGITTEWRLWDLSALGEVTSVQFNVGGSADNGYGFSQPSYFAYDDVAVRFPVEATEEPVEVTPVITVDGKTVEVVELGVVGENELPLYYVTYPSTKEAVLTMSDGSEFMEEGWAYEEPVSSVTIPAGGIADQGEEAEIFNDQHLYMADDEEKYINIEEGSYALYDVIDLNGDDECDFVLVIEAFECLHENLGPVQVDSTEGAEMHEMYVCLTCGYVENENPQSCEDTEPFDGICDVCKAAVACRHVEFNTEYIRVENSETHTVTQTCTNCEDLVGEVMTADCVDVDKNGIYDGVCNLCGGDMEIRPTGTEPQKVDGVYQIGTADELIWFAQSSAAYDSNPADNYNDSKAVLTANIDLAGKNWYSMPQFFRGSFDGQGNTISNMNGSNGLFEKVYGTSGTNAKISNVTINGSISGGESVGAIAGQASYAKFTNCYNKATVSGTNNVGGIVGNSHCQSKGSVTIEHCGNYGSVSGTQYVGGITGYGAVKVALKNCVNKGGVSASSQSAGGIAGILQTSGSSSQQSQNNCSVTSCYNTGKISGGAQVGGILGTQGYSTMKYCLNVGEVTGSSNVGAITGKSNNNTVKISDTFYLDTSCEAGVVGNTEKVAVSARTAEELLTAETTAALGEAYEAGNSYPVLTWEGLGCEHAEAKQINVYVPVMDGEASTGTHTVTLTCKCGEPIGEAVTENCADAEPVDEACDLCGGNVALPVYTVELDKTEASIWAFGDQQIPTGYEAYAGDFPASSELKATVKVNDAETDAAEIIWTSSDDKVATVENGVVTAVGAGEAVITASVNGVEAQCAVKVEAFVAPAYMNVELVGEFGYSVNQPKDETARVIDLTDKTQSRTITVKAPLYRNVNDVKTLASMQAVDWEIVGDAECVEYVVDDDFTLTATFTGKAGVVNFRPVMLNGYTNVMLPIYVSNGFVTEVNIVREDGKAWEYGEKETIYGAERDVIRIAEGFGVKAVSSATNVTQSYNGWMLHRLDEDYATVQVSGSNGESFDLSKLETGLYSLVLRVPTYEQDYNIDPLGGNPQDSTSSEMIYIRVVKRNAMGDVTGDGNINANDAVLILQAAAGGAMSEAQIAAADMNNDGKIDANDAVLILQYSAN